MPAPETLWQQLVDEAGEDAVDSAAGVTVSHAEQDLLAAGFDTKAERAHANVRIAELTGAPDSTNAAPESTTEPSAWVRVASPSPRRSPASRRAVWLVAALVAVATAGGIFYAAAHRPVPPDKPVEAPSATANPPLPSPPRAPKEPPSSHQEPTAAPEDLKLPPPRPHAP